MASLWKDRSGAVAIYTAVVATLLIGSAVLAIDYGRLTVLRVQMQNAADAAAMGGAAQLDAKSNARLRAIDVAQNATNQAGSPQSSGVAGELTVTNVEVLASLPGTSATTDQNARYVRATLTPKNVNLLFQPVLNLMLPSPDPTGATLQATATAQSNPVLCPPPTILACTDALDPAGLDISSPDNAGIQLALRQRDAAEGAPFGRIATFFMLCPPGNPGCDASESSAFAASDGLFDCGSSTVFIAQGAQDDAAIDNGVNIRFGDGVTPTPAENVIYYGQDSDIETMAAVPGGLDGGMFGVGDWNAGEYWLDRHGAALPGALNDATRFQIYLYETGQTFARDGKQTLFPVPADLPAGFTVISSAPDIPTASGGEDPSDEQFDGVPDAGVPSADIKRRLMTVAVSTCEGAAADTTRPVVIGSRFIEFFVTERSQNSIIFGEVVGPVDPALATGFINNVRLVE